LSVELKNILPKFAVPVVETGIVNSEENTEPVMDENVADVPVMDENVAYVPVMDENVADDPVIEEKVNGFVMVTLLSDAVKISGKITDPSITDV